MGINRTLLSDVQASARVQPLREPRQIKGGALSAQIKIANKADKDAAREKSRKANSNAKDTAKIIASQEKTFKKEEKKNGPHKSPSPSGGGGNGRKIVDTPFGPAVDLDAIDKPSKTKKVPTKKPNKTGSKPTQKKKK